MELDSCDITDRTPLLILLLLHRTLLPLKQELGGLYPIQTPPEHPLPIRRNERLLVIAQRRMQYEAVVKIWQFRPESGLVLLEGGLEADLLLVDDFGDPAVAGVQLLLGGLAGAPDLDVLLVAGQDLQVVMGFQPVHRRYPRRHLLVCLPLVAVFVRRDLNSQTSLPP
jgi:hypothetical protein